MSMSEAKAAPHCHLAVWLAKKKKKQPERNPQKNTKSFHPKPRAHIGEKLTINWHFLDSRYIRRLRVWRQREREKEEKKEEKGG